MHKLNKTPEGRAVIHSLILKLEGKYESTGQIIKRIIKENDYFTSPEYACSTIKAVYLKLYELADDIFLHIAKENSVLFMRYE